MPKRSKKRPVTFSGVKISTTASSKSTQHIISRYHALRKRRQQLEKADTEAARSAIQDIDKQMEELGGLDAYQIASQIGQSTTRGGDSSRTLIPWLKKHRQGEGVMRMLEIGALRPDNYKSCPWICNTPIDLQSQHPDILAEDFFQRPLPVSESEAFDIVSCSLVLNFVDDIAKRGLMLEMIRQHLKPTRESLVFLALMTDIGYERVEEHWKPNGKVAYSLWRWRVLDGPVERTRWHRKRVEREGGKRNNFAITLE